MTFTHLKKGSCQEVTAHFDKLLSEKQMEHFHRTFRTDRERSAGADVEKLKENVIEYARRASYSGVESRLEYGDPCHNSA